VISGASRLVFAAFAVESIMTLDPPGITLCRLLGARLHTFRLESIVDAGAPTTCRLYRQAQMAWHRAATQWLEG
jgi:hypothetical protein